MTVKFDIDKIVNYLEQYKEALPSLYEWDASLDGLIDLDMFTKERVFELKKLRPFERQLQVQEAVSKKMRATISTNPILFDKICLWIIKDWGGIKSAKDKSTLALVKDFLSMEKPEFNRIASASKVGAFLKPDENVIYDSRVAYSLNWIILSERAGNKYFPMPSGRNSKMMAFDISVLIRLYNISNYQTSDKEELENRLFISNRDKNIFIDKKEAYHELKKLIQQINKKLWQGDTDKENNLFYTEMLLFAIADREVFKEITEFSKFRNWR